LVAGESSGGGDGVGEDGDDSCNTPFFGPIFSFLLLF